MRELIIDMLHAALGALSANMEDAFFEDHPEPWYEANLDPMERYVREGEGNAIYIRAPNGRTYRVRVTEVREA